MRSPMIHCLLWVAGLDGQQKLNYLVLARTVLPDKVSKFRAA